MNDNYILRWKDADGTLQERTVAETRTMLAWHERMLQDDAALWTTAEREHLEEWVAFFESLLIRAEADLLAAAPLARFNRHFNVEEAA